VDTEVLIVGAGPAGLMAAIELRRRGIYVVIIDKRGDVAPWVKAVCVQPRTLEIWDSIGVARDAPNAATTMRGQLAYVNGRQVGRVDIALPAGEPYRFIARPRYATEKVFAAHLGKFRTTVRRGVELLGFTDDDCVPAALRESGGETSLSARHLIGADGTRSTVRNRRSPAVDVERLLTRLSKTLTIGREHDRDSPLPNCRPR
jgi:2-polyprenyl-6-methoxyphenol hydroxylase-like FAD-dependent oxidoreductase